MNSFQLVMKANRATVTIPGRASGMNTRRSWNAVDNTFVYDGIPGTHMWYDGTPHPWEFKRVWHLEPSLTEPETVYAGVEDAAMFRSTDGGASWHELAGLRQRRGLARDGGWPCIALVLHVKALCA